MPWESFLEPSWVSITKDKIYIGVDNTTVLEGNAGRPAVRIESKKSSLEREVERVFRG